MRSRCRLRAHLLPLAIAALLSLVVVRESLAQDAAAPPSKSHGLIRKAQLGPEALQQQIDEATNFAISAAELSGGLSAPEAAQLRLLPGSKLLDTLAVSPLTGPSTIGKSVDPPKVPAASVNWLGLGGGAVAAHPGVVLLLARLDGQDDFMAQCTGTLVRQNIILTAAHCVCHTTDFFPSGPACVAGTDHAPPSVLLDPDRWRVFFQHAGIATVSHVLVSDEYKFGADTVQGDLALLVLTHPMTWIAPPGLPPDDAAGSADWQEGLAAGFGYSANPDAPNATALQRLVRPGLKSQGRLFQADCATMPFLAPGRALCSAFKKDALDSQATICGGDSGGPLWVGDGKAMEIGVTSGRDDRNCAATGTMGFEMRLANPGHHGWVEAALDKFGAPDSADARWPTFGDNLRYVLDRRHVAVFDEAGSYAAEGWVRVTEPGVVLMTLNSSGRIESSALVDRATHATVCGGMAGQPQRMPNADYCFATVATGQQIRVTARGEPGERLQFVLATFPVGTTFPAPSDE